MNIQLSDKLSIASSDEQSPPTKKKLLCECLWDLKEKNIFVITGNPKESGYTEDTNFFSLSKILTPPEHPEKISAARDDEEEETEEEETEEEDDDDVSLRKLSPEELEKRKNLRLGILKNANAASKASVQYDYFRDKGFLIGEKGIQQRVFGKARTSTVYQKRRPTDSLTARKMESKREQ